MALAKTIEAGEHLVNQIGGVHWISLQENDISVRENVEERMEMLNSVGDLFDKGRWRFPTKVKPGIKCRGEDDEYT
jgi:hypothetical protein